MISTSRFLFSQKYIQRCCATVRMLRKSVKPIRKTIEKPDPGIHRQVALLNLNSEEVEDLENIESDFMNVGASHEQYLRESKAFREQLQHQIVKQKYFAKKLPNFLTWSDKEHIKFLHNTNPQEWTLEKLSEGFPALPDTIAKIIKSNYAKSEHKVQRHDDTVKNNWILFKQRKLDLPKLLTEHLKKFTSRDLDTRRYPITQQVKPTVKIEQKVHGEFSEIITSYEKLKNKAKNEEPQQIHKNINEEPKNKDTYILGNAKINKFSNVVTLSKLKEKIQSKAAKGHRLNEDEIIILSEIHKENEMQQKNENLQKPPVELSKFKVENNSQITTTKTVRDYSHLIYPEKIKIPKDKVKRGCTYKLNDCYYDSDGTFLYRVPGMT